MRRDLVLLDEIVQAAERIIELTSGLTVDAIEEDDLRREAVLWNYTALGEATSQLSDEIRDGHPEVEWRRPVSLRNSIVHGYWSVDMAILVSTAANNLPARSTSVSAPRSSSWLSGSAIAADTARSAEVGPQRLPDDLRCWTAFVGGAQVERRAKLGVEAHGKC